MEYLLAQAPEETKPDEKTEKESATPPEVEQKISGEEEQKQAAKGSGERDDSRKQEKAASGKGSEVEHDKEEAARAENERQPEHQDSGRPAEVKSESATEPGDEKKESDQKVA